MDADSVLHGPCGTWQSGSGAGFLQSSCFLCQLFCWCSKSLPYHLESIWDAETKNVHSTQQATTNYNSEDVHNL